MTDKPKSTAKKKSFLIRNFARLFDEFLEATVIKNEAVNTELREAIDRALIEHYKR